MHRTETAAAGPVRRRVAAAPGGNAAEGFVYAPGTPVASWR
jgi:hypothetical protein